MIKLRVYRVALGVMRHVSHQDFAKVLLHVAVRTLVLTAWVQETIYNIYIYIYIYIYSKRMV
jgi:hypothetical protein